MITRILKRTIIPFVFSFGHCRITTMLNIFEQDILQWSLYIDFAIEIITFNSDTTTTTETTTMKASDGSKDFEINIIIGTVLAACVLIVI